jgi:DNA segregation ATPase FtsK/SpoIIIE-like protein
MSKNDRHHFLVVFILFCLGILILLSLVPTASKPNLLGTPGSLLSYFLYAGFGLCAWVFPAVLFWVSYIRFKDETFPKPGLKLLGLLLTILSVCVLTQVFFPGVQMFSPSQMREGVEWSGQLGLLVGTRMESVLTRFGTVVICLMFLVLAAWLLEKEGHLIQAAKRTWEGFQKGGRYLEENGFGVVSVLKERLGKAIQDFQHRQQAKKVAEEAHAKLEKRQRPTVSTGKPETPVSSIPRIPPPSKPTGRALFTGEADEEKPAVVKPLDEEDLVSAALAEAKGSANSMTTKQKMEAASIEMAEEEEESAEEEETPKRVIRQWQLPTVHILKTLEESKDRVVDDFETVSRTLTETLANFGVEAKVVGVNPGPTVTQYEVQPAAGVKITRIASLENDLALALKCGHLRIVAPIPGKAAVGIEVPNSQGRVVTLKELLAQDTFLASPKKLTVALGRDIAGEAVYGSIKEMPHVLVAGSTGSGKSVCVNTLIASLIFKYNPEELRMVLVDPKRVEMTIYKGLPHLALPVVNDPKEAHLALKWLVREMEDRYQQLAHVGARDIDTFNQKMAAKREAGEKDKYNMYYIVVLVDELADLMMTAKDQVEDSITRLAQMARAVGIHLVLATQRPSVEVITGIIKANFPSRIAFQVFSKVDSRTILDMNGAEALLGRGDMLYLASGAPKPLRLQGAFVTMEEIERLVDFWTSQGGPQFSADLSPAKNKDLVTEESEDELYDDAVEIVMRAKQASTSLLQRRLKIGYGRAARLLDDMQVRGIVGPADGNKPRKILVQTMGASDEMEAEDEGINENLR